MEYISTRGQSPAVDFSGAVLNGLAPDGGLYLPARMPVFSQADLEGMRDLPYSYLALRIMQPLVGDTLTLHELKWLIAAAYECFDTDAVTPLVPLGDENHMVLELFHGPTLAFKDVALQFLGRLFDVFLKKSERRATVIGATSGDTGPAAIAGCAGCENLSIFVLFPKVGPSEVQRRQMTTVNANNVHALAIDGSFDDCQAIVKNLFADKALNAKHNFTAVNSINWARIMAQVVYYFYGALRAGAPERAVSFVVPTGNFGSMFAAYAAGQMGLPIAKLAAATNSNDAVNRFFTSGKIVPQAPVSTLSPSMDIQLPSNLERLLFDLCGRDHAKLCALVETIKTPQGLAITPQQLGMARQYFTSASLDDEETLVAIADVYKRHDYVVDPHTAVGVAVGKKLAAELPVPIIHLATAHPAKFPETIRRALGREPPSSPHLEGLDQKAERAITLPPDTKAVADYIESRA